MICFIVISTALTTQFEIDIIGKTVNARVSYMSLCFTYLLLGNICFMFGLTFFFITTDTLKDKTTFQVIQS